MNWSQITPTLYALDNNMGEVWWNYSDGWGAVAKVNGHVVRLGNAPTIERAKKLVEEFWEAAWALKP